MKVFISVDIEGCAGIFDADYIVRDRMDYGEGREIMIGECNAAVEGALEAGATDIVVNDSHNGMVNLLPSKVHPEARLILGSIKPMSMCQGLDDSYDAAVFIGYHARQGTEHAILAHTYHSGVFYAISVNGVEWGETSINAAVAGCYGVPLVFVSGDQCCAKEIQALHPGVRTLILKESQGRQTGVSIHPEKARRLIREGVAEALRKREEIEPFRPEPPFLLAVDLVSERMADMCERVPGANRVGARRMEFQADNFLEIYRALLCMLTVGGSAVTIRTA